MLGEKTSLPDPNDFKEGDSITFNGRLYVHDGDS
jgi:hypothetical protein